MWVCWVSNKNILTVVWDVLPVIPALKLDSERKKHKNINTDSHIPRYELIREGIWFSEHKQVGLRKELAALMQDDRCVFGLSLSRRGILQEGGRVYLNLYSPSGEKKQGASGYDGLSVLKESHVVSESGQLLLIWNQWDRRRICWERGRERETWRRRSESDRDSS